MKNFAITGVAGYIAPRHLQAIYETKNNLIAALDPNDSVGILDRYFPEVSYFSDFERFDRHLEKMRKGLESHKLDYLTICSPNHLHDAHIRFAFRIGADAICEKPIVLNPWNLDLLQQLEEETGRRVFTLLQLRVHPGLVALKEKFDKKEKKKKADVVLTYITSRGPWYHFSWKGDVKKSGGIGTNIGVHLFDLVMWFFGKVQRSEVHLNAANKMAGFLELENANVRWFLSIDRNDLPEEAVKNNKSTFRSIIADGEELEFTEGFTDLHKKVYEMILSGNGFGIDSARPSIEAVQKMRSAIVVEKPEHFHPLLTKITGAGK